MPGMDGQQVLEIVTSAWGVAMAVSPAMQIRQMIRTGQSQDVSVGYFAVLVVGFMLWVAYGLSKDDYVLAVPNAVATLFGLATIVSALRLRRRAPREPGGALPESGA